MDLKAEIEPSQQVEHVDVEEGVCARRRPFGPAAPPEALVC